mgnify:CR=1 FL=1
MPAFVLKKMIMNNFTAQEVDEDIADSIDFMVERVSGKLNKEKRCTTLLQRKEIIVLHPDVQTFQDNSAL